MFSFNSLSGTFLQLWCAAGVILSGGRTRDGGSIVGASVFYSQPPDGSSSVIKRSQSELEKLNHELKVITVYLNLLWPR